MTNAKRIGMWCALGMLAGCVTEGTETTAAHGEELTLVATVLDGGTDAGSSHRLVGTGDLRADSRVACVDPPREAPPDGWTSPDFEPVPGADLAPRLADRRLALLRNEDRTPALRVVETLEADGDRAELRVGATNVVVRRSPSRTVVERRGVPRPALGFAARPAERTLDAGDEALENVEVVKSYAFDDGVAKVESLRLTRRSDGAILDELDLAAETDDCIAEAYARLKNDLDGDLVLPSDMPPVRFPETPSCTLDECAEVRAAWIRAHHHVWWMHRALGFLNSLPENTRRDVWEMQGRNRLGGPVSAESSTLSYFLGEYEHDRYVAIRDAVGQLWEIIRTGKTGGIRLRHKCPHYPENRANVCFTSDREPVAHHIVKGWINFCPSYFDLDPDVQARTSIHEPLHHLFVNLHHFPQALTDTHVHWHGRFCLNDPMGGQQYDYHEVRELVTFVNERGKDCNHRDLAVKNISNYEFGIGYFGEALLTGWMVAWPDWP